MDLLFPLQMSFLIDSYLFHVHGCFVACTICMPGTLGSQKRVLDALQVMGSCEPSHVGDGDLTSGVL